MKCSLFYCTIGEVKIRKRRKNEKTIFALLTGLFICLGITQIAHADDYLRIGMEAAYAPFNWTQEDDANGAVKIDGTNQYANGYDVQIAKKLLRS